MVKLLKERARGLLLLIAMAGIFLFLGCSMRSTSQTYIRLIVKQQQEQLLLLTRSIAQNLEIYLSDQIRQADVLTGTPGFRDAMGEYYEQGETERMKEYLYAYMLSGYQGPSRIYMLDADGSQALRYNQYPFLAEFDEGLLHLEQYTRVNAGGIGVVFPISAHHYGFTLATPVFGGDGYLGTLVSVYDMEELYRSFIASLNMENQGQILVRNDEGTIFMHPAAQMLGFNERRDIDGFENLPQYREQMQMLSRQYQQETGTAVCTSYSDGILPARKEVVAFSRMNLKGKVWYVSASMDYDQVVDAEHSGIQRITIMFAVILTIVTVSMWAVYVLLQKRQKLAMEAKYLKEINGTLEELYRSQEKVRHYQRLTTIGTLAGGIAHEFNNLLTPILGYSEFLKTQFGKDSPYYEDVSEIQKAGLRAKEIVERILPFSRRETDPSGFRLFCLDEVISEAGKTIRLLLPSDIRLEQSLKDGGVSVYGSPSQIHQVLLNLYANAVQSMEEGGGVLSVSTELCGKEKLPEGYGGNRLGRHIEITVADTGCGMSEEVRGQIFNAFFTTKDSEKGTGLGLSVVKDILIGHSGFIRVESEPGNGSKFVIYLPVGVKSSEDMEYDR